MCRFKLFLHRGTTTMHKFSCMWNAFCIHVTCTIVTVWSKFGLPIFFLPQNIWLSQSLDIMVSYHHVQYHKKSWERSNPGFIQTFWKKFSRLCLKQQKFSLTFFLKIYISPWPFLDKQPFFPDLRGLTMMQVHT